MWVVLLLLHRVIILLVLAGTCKGVYESVLEEDFFPQGSEALEVKFDKSFKLG
jgi:hypothetical protein